MLEMLLGGDALLKTGPGPKALKYGTEQSGYFGRLTQAELFTPTEIFNGVGVVSGSPSTNLSLIWCKFAYKGEIIYIPTRPISTDTRLFNWDELYHYGVVYGVVGSGTYPSGTVTDQSKKISKVIEGNITSFGLRLPAASEALDPIDQASANASKTGELAELMTKVLDKSVAGSATAVWDAITTANFDKTSFVYVKNSGWAPSTAGAPYCTVGSIAGSYNYSGTSKTGKVAGVGWLPVLVYVKPS